MPYVIEVSTPTGRSVLETDKICRNCEVIVSATVYPAELIVLPISGYDVILGID